MTTKAFLVTVELEIEAISCPGVWLCSNGLVSLQLFMLDSCIQTCSKKPIFPIVCNEKFIFYKNFYTQHRLTDLQKQMGREWLYIEFIQWEKCDYGNVLASFQTTLDELLFPKSFRGALSGADMDLLMEPTSLFPGTLAPKIEISTKTTIAETVFNKEGRNANTCVVNPKLLVSSNPCNCKKRATRRVCHSVQYSRSRKNRLPTESKKEPFCFKKAEDNLIARKFENVPSCKCSSCFKNNSNKPICRKYAEEMASMRTKQKKLLQEMEKYKSVHLRSGQSCKCGSNGHTDNKCPLCVKYDRHFKVSPANITTAKSTMRNSLYTKDGGSLKDVLQVKQCKCGDKSPGSTQRAQSCYCTNNDEDDDNGGICDGYGDNVKSLAATIHERLKKTLDCIPNGRQIFNDMSCSSPRESNFCQSCKGANDAENNSYNGDTKNNPECPFCKYNCVV